MLNAKMSMDALYGMLVPAPSSTTSNENNLFSTGSDELLKNISSQMPFDILVDECMGDLQSEPQQPARRSRKGRRGSDCGFTDLEHKLKVPLVRSAIHYLNVQ